MAEKILYELANPSDPFTFYAPNIEVAGMAAAMLSTCFGATPANRKGESSPVLFGWDDWMEKKGIDEQWVKDNSLLIADALESFVIGDASRRADVESMLRMLPDDKKEQWLNERQYHHSTSTIQIAEVAFRLAKKLRKPAQEA